MSMFYHDSDDSFVVSQPTNVTHLSGACNQFSSNTTSFIPGDLEEEEKCFGDYSLLAKKQEQGEKREDGLFESELFLTPSSSSTSSCYHHDDEFYFSSCSDFNDMQGKPCCEEETVTGVSSSSSSPQMMRSDTTTFVTRSESNCTEDFLDDLSTELASVNRDNSGTTSINNNFVVLGSCDGEEKKCEGVEKTNKDSCEGDHLDFNGLEREDSLAFLKEIVSNEHPTQPQPSHSSTPPSSQQDPLFIEGDDGDEDVFINDMTEDCILDINSNNTLCFSPFPPSISDDKDSSCVVTKEEEEAVASSNQKTVAGHHHHQRRSLRQASRSRGRRVSQGQNIELNGCDLLTNSSKKAKAAISTTPNTVKKMTTSTTPATTATTTATTVSTNKGKRRTANGVTHSSSHTRSNTSNSNSQGAAKKSAVGNEQVTGSTGLISRTTTTSTTKRSSRQRVDYGRNKNARMAKENRERKKAYLVGLENRVEELEQQMEAQRKREENLLKKLCVANEEIDGLRLALKNNKAFGQLFSALKFGTSTSQPFSLVPPQPPSSSSSSSNTNEEGENEEGEGNEPSSKRAKKTVIPFQINLHIQQ
eukprot:m.89897 g.89897  ORF g.89897 m.89897 type:complete len:588 (+) comp12299_c1_seq13:661-2424(+)